MRFLTRRSTLYTEMVVDSTLCYTDSLEDHLGKEALLLTDLCCGFCGECAGVKGLHDDLLFQDFKRKSTRSSVNSVRVPDR